MKKYILFASENYYPSGGTEDLYGYYNTIEQAKVGFIAFCQAEKYNEKWEHIDVWGEITRVGKRELKSVMSISVCNENPESVEWEL